VRVLDAYTGNPVNLQTGTDTVVDLDVEQNHIWLNHHTAIGQWMVTSANNTFTSISGSLVTLPANTAASGIL
jgi:hypothetical protein